MADIKREDITLSDWTKGISADEFAWGSYFYSEGISSWYNTKWFELWYKVYKTPINKRSKWYPVSLVQSFDGFMTFTRDWRIETEYRWNSLTWAWDGNWWWALYAYRKEWYLWDWYLNWVKYGKYAVGIRQTTIDVIDYENAFNPNDEILSNTDLSDSTWWTLGTWWTITDDWAVHTPGETWALTTDISGASLTSWELCRVAVKITNRTAWKLNVKIDSDNEDISWGWEWWFVVTTKCGSTNTTLTLTPSSSFDGTVELVNLHKYDTTKINTYSITQGTYSDNYEDRPALLWEWDLYIACWEVLNIVSLWWWTSTYKNLIDKNFRIVSMTQQAWYILIWATDGYDSRQYYWNGVDAVATEVIEWKWLIIQWVTGTETISYVLTTSWATRWTITGYEYRLYAVSWYQRNLIASKLYQYNSWDYIEAPQYNANKKFDFNDVTNDHSMTIFLDSLYIPGCDWIYKYWNDIPWVRSAWTRPIKYDTWSTNIVLWQMWDFVWVWYRSNGINYIWWIDNRLYAPKGYLVTESIYWDKLSTRKALEKIKIWYKNVASTVGNIKVYAIVDDNYFWRFRPTVTPTKRPSVWDVYSVAHNTTAEVIDVDTTNGVITLKTVSDTGSYLQLANTTLTKVSWEWDDTISVGYNYDNMCLVKTIESEKQWYNSELIFGKDFVDNYLPYWHKIQFVIELNSNDNMLSPEIYEISMISDITDTVL